MTAEEVYESVTNGGASAFTEAVAILDKHAPWCLIGGLAVNHYVEPVYTIDADVVVIAGNLEPVQEKLVDAGFSIKHFAHPVNATRRESKLSLQFTVAAKYQPFIERAVLGEVLGCRVPIASLADLIQGKVWAWSDDSRRFSRHKKDELDLIRIAETYPELRRMMPDKILAQIENADRGSED